MKIQDILLKGMELENSGVEFYEKAAGLTKNETGKKIFIGLKKAEEHHYRIFKEMSESGNPKVGRILAENKPLEERIKKFKLFSFFNSINII